MKFSGWFAIVHEKHKNVMIFLRPWIVLDCKIVMDCPGKVIILAKFTGSHEKNHEVFLWSSCQQPYCHMCHFTHMIDLHRNIYCRPKNSFFFNLKNVNYSWFNHRFFVHSLFESNNKLKINVMKSYEKVQMFLFFNFSGNPEFYV